jgi:hypothetical protein
VEHFAEPVHRQNDAIKIGNDMQQHQSTTTSTSVSKVTRVVSQSPGRIVLKDDVIFVNNGGAVGNGIQAGEQAGDGTAEHPVLEVNDGATIASANNIATGRVWNVYTQGTGVPYTQDVTVSRSVNFISNVIAIVAPDGQTFGGGPWPSLRGRVSAQNIGFFGMEGYEFRVNSEGPALDLSNVTSALVKNTDIENSGGRAIDVFADGATVSNITLGNSIGIRDINGNAIDIFATDNASLSIIFDGNSLQNITGDAVQVTRGASSVLNFNGTISNSFINVSGLDYNQTGTPSGTFILNNVPVSSGVDH